MTYEIVRFLPVEEKDYDDNPAVLVCVTSNQHHVDTMNKDGETVSSLKCKSFPHALMHAAMLLVYIPGVDYTVEGG